MQWWHDPAGLLGNGVLYEWCNAPSLEMLSRFCGSSGYNYFMLCWLYLKKILKRWICHTISHQKNIFILSLSLFPKQFISSSRGVSQNCGKEAPVLVAVFFLDDAWFKKKNRVVLFLWSALWVIKFISKSAGWWNVMKEPGQHFWNHVSLL